LPLTSYLQEIQDFGIVDSLLKQTQIMEIKKKIYKIKQSSILADFEIIVVDENNALILGLLSDQLKVINKTRNKE